MNMLPYIPLFLVILSVMVFFHELGHFVLAKLGKVKVEEFGIGFPPRLWATRRGETEYSINLIPLGGFTKMLGEEDPTEPRSLARAPKRWRVAILSAGSIMNIALAVLLFAGAYMTGWPTVTSDEVEAQIVKVAADSPAERAGLRQGDIVVSLAGTKISGAQHLKEETRRHLETTVPMVVKRGEHETTLNVTPRTPQSADEGPLGVTIQDRPTKIEMVAHDPLTSLVLGARQTWNVFVVTFSVPVLAIKGILPLEMARPSGPIGIFQVTSQAAAATIDTGWLFPILNVMGVFSAGLGLANLLPLPALDGGRLVFVVIEAIRGKRISPEREGLIHLIGMAVLLSLMVVVSCFDILFPIGQIDWTP